MHLFLLDFKKITLKIEKLIFLFVRINLISQAILFKL